MSAVVPTHDMKVLIADDNAVSSEVFRMILAGAGYEHLETTRHAPEIEQFVRLWEPDLLVLDLHMPELSGFETLARLRRYLAPPVYLPVLVVTADETPDSRRRALSLGARDFVTKPVDPAEVLSRVRNLLQTRRLLSDPERPALRHIEALEATRLELLQRLARTAAFGAGESPRHSERVARTSVALAEALALQPAEVEAIGLAALLHDLGNVGVPSSMLRAAGPLSPHERSVMQRHTQIGASLLAGADSPVLELARQIALHHHERWDGGGYPHGLRGNDVPQAARIVAVAEVFDALGHDRPYRAAWPLATAAAEIAAGAGTQFDPEVCAAFATLAHGQLVDAGDAPYASAWASAIAPSTPASSPSAGATR